MNAILRSKRLNVEVPARCTQHQCVKNTTISTIDKKRRCLLCSYYHRELYSVKCYDCLGTENLDNFEINPTLATAEWVKFLK